LQDLAAEIFLPNTGEGGVTERAVAGILSLANRLTSAGISDMQRALAVIPA